MDYSLKSDENNEDLQNELAHGVSNPMLQSTSASRSDLARLYSPEPSATYQSSPYGPLLGVSSNTYGYTEPLELTPEQDFEMRQRGFPLVAFAPSGVLLTSHPRDEHRFAKSGPVTVRVPGLITFHNETKALGLDSSFPGPLLTARGMDKSKRKDIGAWIESRIRSIQAVDMAKTTISADDIDMLENKKLLMQILRLLLESNNNLDDKAIKELRFLLIGDEARANANEASEHDSEGLTMAANIGSQVSRTVLAADIHREYVIAKPDLREISNRLERGNRLGALRFALERQMWSHAMVISSSISKDAWLNVVHEFVQSELGGMSDELQHDSLRTLYLMFAGAGSATAMDSFSGKSSSVLSNNSSLNANEWKRTVSAMLANWAPGTTEAIASLGRNLLVGRHDVYSAHCCYVIANAVVLFGPNIETNSPICQLSLVGADPGVVASGENGHNAWYLEPDSIELSEILEYITSSKGQSPLVKSHLFPFKLSKAWRLADSGQMGKAQQYCEFLGNEFSKATKASAPVIADMVSSLRELSDQIMESGNILDDGSSSASESWFGRSMTKPKLDNFWTSVESRLSKFVAGTDENMPPKTPAEEGPFSRLGSLQNSAISLPSLAYSSTINSGQQPPQPVYSQTSAPSGPLFSPHDLQTVDINRPISAGSYSSTTAQNNGIPNPNSASQGLYAPAGSYSASGATRMPGSSLKMTPGPYSPKQRYQMGSKPSQGGQAAYVPSPGAQSGYVPQQGGEHMYLPQQGNESMYAPQHNENMYVVQKGENVPHTPTTGVTAGYMPQKNRASGYIPQASAQSHGQIQQGALPYNPQSDSSDPNIHTAGRNSISAGYGYAGPTQNNGVQMHSYIPSRLAQSQEEPYITHPQNLQESDTSQQEQDATTHQQAYSVGAYTPKGESRTEDANTDQHSENRSESHKAKASTGGGWLGGWLPGSSTPKQTSEESETKSEPSEPKAGHKSQETSEPKKQTSGGGWFGWGKAKKQDDGHTVYKAKLGEESQFYYDKEQKRWVNKSAALENTVAAPPPPPKAAATVSSSVPPSAAPGPAPMAQGSPSMAPGLSPMAQAPPSMAPGPSSSWTPPGPAGLGGAPSASPASPAIPAAPSPAMPPAPVPSRSSMGGDSLDELLGGPAMSRGSTPGSAAPGAAAGRRGKAKARGRYVDVMAAKNA